MKSENTLETICYENVPKKVGNAQKNWRKSRKLSKNSEKMFLIQVPEKHFSANFRKILGGFQELSADFR